MQTSKKKRGKGQPINIKACLKVKKYRKKGLSFAEIAKLMDSDVKTVFRWSNYSLAEKKKGVDK